MGYGFFRVRFFKADGTPDPETAKKALEWAQENLDWVKELKPFALDGEGNWGNNDDEWTDGVDIERTGVPDEIGGWVKQVGDAVGAAVIAASETQDFTESDMDNIGTVAAVYKNGEVEESGYIQDEEAYEEADSWMDERIPGGTSKEEDGSDGGEGMPDGCFLDNHGNWASLDSARYNIVGCPDRDFVLLPVRAMITDDEEEWNRLPDLDIDKDDLPELPFITMYDEEFQDYEVEDGEDWLQLGYGLGDLLDADGNTIQSLKDVDHADNGDGETVFWRVPFADLDEDKRKAGEYVLTEEAREKWRKKLGISPLVIEDGVLTNYKGKDSSVVIPEGVTEIGDKAFKRCTSLASVSIPEGVTKIGEEAFMRCTSLASVSIPEGVTKIGDCAFNGCTSLTSVSIPASVTEIGRGAFANCTSLATVSIPASVTAIGEDAFGYCTSLASISIPGSVTEIGRAAFEGCTSLASVSVPASVTEIGDYAFKYCTSLALVSIPASVTKIGESAFKGCTSLASVSIPKGVTEIGFSAFEGCTSLKEVCYGGTKAQWFMLSAFNELPETATVLCSDGEGIAKGMSEVIIPEGVTKIDKWAFSGCTSLTSVTIPASMTEIGDYAFKGCTALASVSIPEGVTKIDEEAFKDCTSLTSVTIPASMTEIGDSAFSGCSSLKEIHFGGTKEQWAAVKKGDFWNEDVPAKEVLVRKQ